MPRHPALHRSRARLDTRPVALGVLVGSLVAGGLAVAAPAAAASPDVVVNEVYGGGGNSGATFTNDFVELVNRGSAAVSVDGWSVQYASAGGTSWQVTALSGSIPAGGSYLVQEAAGTGGSTALPVPDVIGSIPMSGTAGKIALVPSTTALTCGTACAGTPAVRDLVGYGPSAVGGEGTPTAAPSNTTSVARTTGPDTDVNSADFVAGAPTPQGSGGSPDPDPDPEPVEAPACDSPAIPIGSVQGTSDTSPSAPGPVTVAGTVVGDLQDGGLGGFAVQDAGDGDPATSDGVFVYAPGGAAVALGDQVTVRGAVTEYNGLTELTDVQYVVCGTTELPAAAPLVLPSSDAEREALESMLVAPTEPLTVTEVYGLNTYGEVVLAQGGRLLTPTEVAEPGAPAQQVAAANAARSITLDDGSTANLSPFSGPAQAPPYLTPADPVRVGDTAVLPPVVLGYGFDAWRLQPADGTTAGTTFSPTNPRPTAPPTVGGDLRIADFNVLNYFVDFPSEFGDAARGADDAAELAEQQAKIVTAITTLDADVITLHEIENSAVLTPETPYRAVETLVAAINAAAGVDTWTYVQAHEDTDVITNAIIYRTDRVTAVGAPSVPADLSAFDNARSPIAQTFDANGEVFTIVANHLKSKGSGTGANADTGDGQGASNPDRVAQAQALVTFAGQLAATTGDPDVLLTGDFNAYRFEDPIDVVTAAGFTDMGPVLAPDQYSYVFDGGSGSLDHVFASASMAGKLTGMGVWDINAVESFGYEYDGYEPLYTADAYRASDHNPTVFGISTPPADMPATATISDPRPFRGDRVTLTGAGFAPGERVTATLASRGTVGSAVADADGAVAISFRVPVLLPAGDQQLTLTGASGESAGTTFTLRSVLAELIARLLTRLGR